MEFRVLVFGEFEKNPKCVAKNSVSLVLDHPSLNEAGTKDYDVPPSKDTHFYSQSRWIWKSNLEPMDRSALTAIVKSNSNGKKKLGQSYKKKSKQKHQNAL